jgi:hypothetical protein
MPLRLRLMPEPAWPMADGVSSAVNELTGAAQAHESATAATAGLNGRLPFGNAPRVMSSSIPPSHRPTSTLPPAAAGRSSPVVTNRDDQTTAAPSPAPTRKICWDVPVSFSMLAIPLHTLDSDGWDRATATGSSFGLPDHRPEPQALPTVAQVVEAFTSAGCHGEAWFTLQSPGTFQGLPPCPDPGECAKRRGLDLGEITLIPAPRTQTARALPPARLSAPSLSANRPRGICQPQ